MATSQTPLAEVDTTAQVIEAIKKHGGSIDWGLGRRVVYHADKVPLPTGIADLLLITDDSSTLYVVEILPGECSAEDVGRLLGHCGWLTTMMNTKAGRPAIGSLKFSDVQGILLAKAFDAGARCALALCSCLTAKTFSFSIELGNP